MNLSRRSLIAGGLSFAAASVGRLPTKAQQPAPPAESPTDRPNSPLNRICIFTDLLDDFGLTYAEVAALLKQLKVAGPDLTVRQGGLVPPAQVAEELPKAVKAFRDQGLSVPMLSTGIVSADDPITRATLSTMSQLGIRYYKLGYYRYSDLDKWESQIAATGRDLAGLIKLNQEAGVEAGFHNHAGNMVGAPMWDLVILLEQLKTKWISSYFDPAHATVEGGEFGWRLGFERLSTHITMVAIKDFVWEKVDGRYKVRWCPLGQGMVRWSEFFKLLKRVPFQGPISLHIEYDPGGNTKMARVDNCLQAAARDLRFLREKLAES